LSNKNPEECLQQVIQSFQSLILRKELLVEITKDATKYIPTDLNSEWSLYQQIFFNLF
jgi:hypothetical protein